MPAPLVFEPRLAQSREARLCVLQEEILELKRQRNAVILAHNYQVKEIQDIADFCGDSLGLSYQAAGTQADVIAFCGVHFMAETAKIISPTKTVLLPDLAAGCSLADSCPAEKLAAFRAANPNTKVVAYINCTAAVKALSDVICTSGNAIQMVQKFAPEEQILFVPDQNLGRWVSKKTGRKLLLWPGNCYVHVLFTVKTLEALKAQFPDAPLVAHPECPEAICDRADEVCSTEKMIHFCKTNPAERFIIATETGMIHRLQREIPNKTFIAGPTDHCACNECRFMKLITLEKLRNALRDMTPQIEVPAAICEKALLPIQRMLDWSKA
ncbi:MAG: quinolinate synthase [Verrucomicrobia bacterium 21-51-4]|nr:MAG: quinolinate synthase [Verrucomicrobia bacterium 21-51-4]